MKMRITHISDTHNKHNQLNGKLPGGDLLIHSGDISSIGRENEVERFIKWFNGIDNYTNKVFIAGNHDLSFESEELFQRKSSYFDRKMYEGIASLGKPQWLEILLGSELDSNVFYLENNCILIDDIKIWGSPYSPTFGRDWAFNVDRGHDAIKVWNKIPKDTDIVITHTPIYGYCDRASNTNENVGCANLYQRLNELNVQLHFSGHIHEAYGYKPTKWGYAFNGCNCNLSYEVYNNPITFDYDFISKEINFV